MKAKEKIYQYIVNQEWNEAIILLSKELSEDNENHWLLATLGISYFGLKDYSNALQYTEKAIQLAPNCPLTLNYYAAALSMKERKQEAIDIWQKLINTELKQIAFDECGEGLRFAKSLINDCRVEIGTAYNALGDKTKAISFYNNYLENRQRGIYSNFTKKEILNEIKELENEISKSKHL